jgi:hypothetical protein
MIIQTDPQSWLDKSPAAGCRLALSFPWAGGVNLFRMGQIQALGAGGIAGVTGGGGAKKQGLSGSAHGTVNYLLITGGTDRRHQAGCRGQGARGRRGPAHRRAHTSGNIGPAHGLLAWINRPSQPGQKRPKILG